MTDGLEAALRAFDDMKLPAFDFEHDRQFRSVQEVTKFEVELTRQIPGLVKKGYQLPFDGLLPLIFQQAVAARAALTTATGRLP
jgi:hypothetical protein